jgi:hypothetical protein
MRVRPAAGNAEPVSGTIKKRYRLVTDSNGGAPGERRVRISRIGGWPKRRLYSRLNWLALSYPTSKAALAASRPSTSMIEHRPDDPNLPNFLKQVGAILAWRDAVAPTERFWE